MITHRMMHAVGVLGLILATIIAVQAVAHEPIQNMGSCPSATSWRIEFAPLPKFEHNVICSPVTEWPPVGSYNFCAYMDTVYCSLAALSGIAPEVMDYGNLLRCLDGDINGPIVEDPIAIVPVTISVNSDGICNINWYGNNTHVNVQIPDWNPGSSWYMGFGARTGGRNDYHIVDDFQLTGSTTFSEDFSGAPAGSLFGHAVITRELLQLTADVNDQRGSWSFLPDAPATNLNVSYMQFIGGGGGTGADGMCFFYGPGANSEFGEGGPADTTGLRVTFHTYGDLANTIRLVYNGEVLLDVVPTIGDEELSLRFPDVIPVSGNGMPDGQYDFALLAYVLNTPEEPLHDAAHIAFQENYIFFKCLTQELVHEAVGLSLARMLVPYLVPSLPMLLAGYATMGDDDTNVALDLLLDMLSDLDDDFEIDLPPGGIEEIALTIPEIGPYADFDGDGFANIDEFFHVEEYLTLTPEAYMNYALNPPQLQVGGAKYYQVGSQIRLFPLLQLGGVIESASWEKDGAPLGTGTPLIINNSTYDDAGEYELTITHRMGPSKSVGEEHAVGMVLVGDDPVPAAGLVGLAALTGAVALFAAKRMRRRT